MNYEVMILTGEPNSKQTVEEVINNVKIIRWPTWSWKEAYHIPRRRNELKLALKKLIKNSKLVVLEKTGHSPHLEKANELSKIVIDFLEDKHLPF